MIETGTNASDIEARLKALFPEGCWANGMLCVRLAGRATVAAETIQGAPDAAEAVVNRMQSDADDIKEHCAVGQIDSAIPSLPNCGYGLQHSPEGV